MKENFFTSMLMENGKISHKRTIAVAIAGVLAWAIIYAMLRANTAPERKNIIDGVMIFVLVMSGVATIAQIASIVKGTPVPKDEQEAPVITTKTTTETKIE